jgi:hypothetical protein
VAVVTPAGTVKLYAAAAPKEQVSTVAVFEHSGAGTASAGPAARPMAGSAAPARPIAARLASRRRLALGK